MATTAISPSLKNLCDRIQQNDATLTKLYLYGQAIGDTGVAELAKVLPGNTVLKSVYLQCNDIEPRGATILAGIMYQTKIKCLNLGGNRLGSEGVAAFRATLEHQESSLEELILWDNRIGDEGVESLMEGLYHNTSLRELNLSRNRIGDKGATAIKEMLKQPRSPQPLKILHLNRNSISSKGVMALAEGLQFNDSLEILCLESNQICDQGLRVFGTLLKTNSGLQKMWVSNNKITRVGAEAFVKTSLSQNYFIRDISVCMYGHMEKSIENEMEFYLKLNQSGRQLLRHTNSPPGLWAHVLGKIGKKHDPSLMFYFLKENPGLLA